MAMVTRGMIKGNPIYICREGVGMKKGGRIYIYIAKDWA